MTLIPIIRRYPTHLTPVIGTLIAWHTTFDLQAVRLPEGSEVLLLSGRKVDMEAAGLSTLPPTQVVINICMTRGRAASASIARLSSHLVGTLSD